MAGIYVVLKVYDNVSILFQPLSDAREEVALCNKSAYLGREVNIRLKGENSVAMGTAHRLVLEAAPSLKDLHRLELYLFKYRSAYAPSELCTLEKPRMLPKLRVIY